MNLSNRALTALLAVATAYTAVTLISNVASLRIVEFFGLSIDAGTLLFPLTFLLRDLVHRVGGLKVARVVVICAAAFNGLAAVVYAAVAVLPPDLTVGAQEEFGIVLAMSWRIVLASVLSQLTSELVDGELYAWWERKFGKKWVEGRVAFSNAFSVPLDSLVFTAVAFAGLLPFGVLLSIFLGNIVLKYLIGTLFAPVLRLFPQRVHASS